MSKGAEEFANALVGTCDRCRTEPTPGLHTCPYRSDVNNDDETLCNCCNHCRSECAADI